MLLELWESRDMQNETIKTFIFYKISPLKYGLNVFKVCSDGIILSIQHRKLGSKYIF